MASNLPRKMSSRVIPVVWREYGWSVPVAGGRWSRPWKPAGLQELAGGRGPEPRRCRTAACGRAGLSGKDVEGAAGTPKKKLVPLRLGLRVVFAYSSNNQL